MLLYIFNGWNNVNFSSSLQDFFLVWSLYILVNDKIHSDFIVVKFAKIIHHKA